MSYGGGGGYPRKKPQKKSLWLSPDAYKALRLIDDSLIRASFKYELKGLFDCLMLENEFIEKFDRYFSGEKNALSETIWNDKDYEYITNSFPKLLKNRAESQKNIEVCINRIHSNFSKKKD